MFSAGTGMTRLVMYMQDVPLPWPNEHNMEAARYGVHPLDAPRKIDRCLPETLYAVMLIVVISARAGSYSLDAVIWRLIGHRIG